MSDVLGSDIFILWEWSRRRIVIWKWFEYISAFMTSARHKGNEEGRRPRHWPCPPRQPSAQKSFPGNRSIKNCEYLIRLPKAHPVQTMSSLFTVSVCNPFLFFFPAPSTEFLRFQMNHMQHFPTPRSNGIYGAVLLPNTAADLQFRSYCQYNYYHRTNCNPNKTVRLKIAKLWRWQDYKGCDKDDLFVNHTPFS